MCSLCPAETTNQDKNKEHGRQAAHVDCGSPETWHQELADNAADDVASRESDVNVEGLELGEAGSFQEDHRIAQNCVAAKDLSSPDDAILETGVSDWLGESTETHFWCWTHDFGSSQICSTEAIK